MHLNLETWQEKQLHNYKNKLTCEYIYEDKESFNISFDKNMETLIYKIFKEDIKSKQDIISELFHISNINKIHSRLNKKIYKELLYKLNKEIKD